MKTGSHTAAYGVFCREKTTSLGAKGLYLSSLLKNGICCFLGGPSFACSSLSSSHIGRDGKGSPFLEFVVSRHCPLGQGGVRTLARMVCALFGLFFDNVQNR